MDSKDLRYCISNHYIVMVSSMNLDKIIHWYEIFSWEVYKPKYPYLVPSPLNIRHPIKSLPKFNDHLPIFNDDGIITTYEHLQDFSNSCTILGKYNNDRCMLLFINSIQGHATSIFVILLDEVSFLLTLLLIRSIYCWEVSHTHHIKFISTVATYRIISIDK
jgi:hypothetical protein